MLRYYSAIFSFFLTCLFALSCGQHDGAAEPPEGLIQEQQMVDLLVSIHILEQQITEARLPKLAKQDSFNVYSEEIFLAAGVDSSRFNQSYTYYSGQIDQFHRIMIAVADSLSAMRDRAKDNPTQEKAVPQTESATADSTKKQN